jgi:hypothetical protein
MPQPDLLGVTYPTDLPSALLAIRQLTEALRQLRDRLVQLEKRV